MPNPVRSPHQTAPEFQVPTKGIIINIVTIAPYATLIRDQLIQMFSPFYSARAEIQPLPRYLGHLVDPNLVNVTLVLIEHILSVEYRQQQAAQARAHYVYMDPDPDHPGHFKPRNPPKPEENQYGYGSQWLTNPSPNAPSDMGS
jgi:hypothetical protein